MDKGTLWCPPQLSLPGCQIKASAEDHAESPSQSLWEPVTPHSWHLQTQKWPVGPFPAQTQPSDQTRVHLHSPNICHSFSQKQMLNHIIITKNKYERNFLLITSKKMIYGKRLEGGTNLCPVTWGQRQPQALEPLESSSAPACRGRRDWRGSQRNPRRQ